MPAGLRLDAPDTKYGIAVVLVFYSVGIAGILFPGSRSTFLSLFPVALLLSLATIIIWHQGQLTGKGILAMFSIAVAGFLVEVAGVNTGVVFGSYSYGSALGPELFGTPLIIGVNWLILSYSAASLTGTISNPVLKIIAGALMMVLYDFVTEHAAPLTDMWHWEDGKVPFQNYAAWFLVSLLFQCIIHISYLKPRNRIVPVLIAAQLIFLGISIVAIR